MTTIAWDGKTLAADRLSVGGNTRFGEITKIVKSPSGVLAGGAGNLTTTAGFIRWVKDGMKGKKPPLSGSTILMIYPDGSVEIHDENGYSPVEAEYAAIGSGEDYALAVMALGHTAKEAVGAAIKVSVVSGGGIDCLTLDKPSVKKANGPGKGTKRNTRRRG